MGDPTRVPDNTTPTYSQGHVPEDGEAPGGHTWGEFKKHATTRALRVEGPFEVQTSEGKLTCQDGYLAIDARGYPYPIATDEFELIYAPVEDAQPPDAPE